MILLSKNLQRRIGELLGSSEYAAPWLRIENSRSSSRNKLSAPVYGSPGAIIAPELPYTGAYVPLPACFCWNYCYMKLYKNS
jgi:hypothetical protein